MQGQVWFARERSLGMFFADVNGAEHKSRVSQCDLQVAVCRRHGMCTRQKTARILNHQNRVSGYEILLHKNPTALNRKPKKKISFINPQTMRALCSRFALRLAQERPLFGCYIFNRAANP